VDHDPEEAGGVSARLPRLRPETVARFGDADVSRLMADAGIVRSRAKILAAVESARIYLDMDRAGESFSSFVWSFVDDRPVIGGRRVRAQSAASEALSQELRARGFKFVGPVITYAWMQAVGLVNDHAPNCFRRDVSELA
jgi:DNA-3-methyladenine glycosylase I